MGLMAAHFLGPAMVCDHRGPPVASWVEASGHSAFLPSSVGLPPRSPGVFLTQGKTTIWAPFLWAEGEG